MDNRKIDAQNYEEAVKKAVEFIDGGNVSQKKTIPRKLYDWEQDEQIIFSAINKARFLSNPETASILHNSFNNSSISNLKIYFIIVLSQTHFLKKSHITLLKSSAPDFTSLKLAHSE